MDERDKTWILIRTSDNAISGPYYSKEEAEQMAARQNSAWNANSIWVVMEETSDGAGAVDHVEER